MLKEKSRAAADTALIRVEDLHKSYTQAEMVTEVLKGVDLKIQPGEFTALMGPSGSGKSTLLHLIGLLERPSSGQYFLDGKDVSDLSDDKLSELRNATIGFVFQNFYLIPYASAQENVILPGLYGEKSRGSLSKRAKELLDRVGLADRAGFRPSRLSGGQQQRVALARALINEPALILADEPTGQLDSSTSKDIMNLFRDINEQGTTIIVVTHDDFTAGYATRKVQLLDGKVLSE
jgi:putative ABC transport system ATP-binding protein